jgi:hypothetical protein
MKYKKAISIMTLLILSFSVMGCGKAETSEVQESSSEEYSFDKIELNKDNVFAFGINQTNKIENIVKKYGIKTSHKVTEEADMMFVDDEKGVFTGDKGHIMTTPKSVRVNDGGDNDYEVSFGAVIKKDDRIRADLLITIDYPVTQEFKFDNFMMFKELLETIYSNDFDITTLESSAKDLIATVPPGEKKNIPKVVVGNFQYTIAYQHDKNGINKLIFFIS